ncbi:outer membrane protein OmpA-like peptidoglycan-associated protein [Pseudomonas lini]|nr:outer membrane protein OmpA-like peptidoglycan-associated protein [Pseudomonas lini]
MAPKLTRGLWLWAGSLALALLAVVPLTAATRAIAVLALLCFVVLAWCRAGRRAAALGESLTLAGHTSLPPAAYPKPVVLVCGDGLASLFGATAVEQLALHLTKDGCYVRVPKLEHLPSVTAGLMALRPEWGAQLSVMFIVNPAEHTDTAVLAGQIRAFSYQVGLVRKRGVVLPLLLASYQQASRGEGPWFSWQAGEGSPSVHAAGACVSLADWQRQSSDSATHAGRLHTSVRLNSVVAWLDEAVLHHFARGETRHCASLPRVCAITLVPVLPQSVAGNLWQQWRRNKLALVNSRQAEPGEGTRLPFPDPLLHLLPVQEQHSPLRRACVIASWLFAMAGVGALASSAWQNTLLVRQITDDLRRYTSIPPTGQRDRPDFALREEAFAQLRLDATRLDHYYRQGAPLALGLGLYRGEPLRMQVLATIAGHRHPATAPMPAGSPRPVRLDSLSLFGTGSARLKPGSTKVLVNALVGIKAQPGWLIVIAGHTDATGNAGHNLQLSRARAAAVHDWIKHMGDIPDSCFAVQGFGASQPIASNDTEAGRSANRRVDIRLVPEEGACVLPAPGPDVQPPVAMRDIHVLREGASHGNSGLSVAER